ncbi:hypothetical protein EDC04DRAFT_2611863 [Pisolithus marmoratus]|nr:hypothetical protein EDC04DRAFT_2611863 [Pisolithus marmoratus]
MAFTPDLGSPAVCMVFGFFVHVNGDCVKTFRTGSSTATYHCVYETTIQCTSGVVFPDCLYPQKLLCGARKAYPRSSVIMTVNVFAAPEPMMDVVDIQDIVEVITKCITKRLENVRKDVRTCRDKLLQEVLQDLEIVAATKLTMPGTKFSLESPAMLKVV